jgi:hypothetical protein
MISTKLQMTAQTPSCFGMPMSGSAFRTTGIAALTNGVVRDRQGADVAVKGYFPGTSAWRPPSC